MKTPRTPKSALVMLLLVAGLLLVTTIVAAAGILDLSWWSVDGGGETSMTGGTYALAGSIGQPDAGDLTGANYALHGGFLVGTPSFSLFLPNISN